MQHATLFLADDFEKASQNISLFLSEYLTIIMIKSYIYTFEIVQF